MRLFFAAILSLITLVGGHFVNRRFDRVVMFFGLALLVLCVWWVAYTTWVTNAFQSGELNEKMLEGFPASGFYLTSLAIWIGSVVATVTDGFRQRPELQQKWSVSGVVGAVSLSLTAVCLVAYYAWMSRGMIMSLSQGGEGAGSYQSSWKQADAHFSQYIYFDWIRDSDKEREPPPAGKGQIVGQFIYAGKPAQGVKLSVLLAGGYETELLTTDNKGLFKIPISPGSWTVELVKVSGWLNKPSNKSLFVTTGLEPSLEKGKYSKTNYTTRGKGLVVQAMEDQTGPVITFEIRENMVLVWPDSEKGTVPTTVDKGIISWEEYPGAAQYQVLISSVKRRDNGATYSPIISRNVVKDTQFPLTHLTSMEDDQNEHEYSVEIYAFDENGNFRSESDRWYRNSDIKLTDNRKLVPDNLVSILPTGSRMDEKEIEKAFANRKRLAAVEVLIEDGLLEAAEQMLKGIEGPTEPGELPALQGYLLAKKNQCEEAQQWFDRALETGGRSCVPTRFREACE